MAILTTSTYLPDYIKRRRLLKKKSYHQAAREIGISASTIHGIEHGTIDPRWSTLQKILEWTDE